MSAMTHRGGMQTHQNYRGVPIHAADNVHEVIAALLKQRLPKGARVADIGAGHGALSLRLQDMGFDVKAFDLDCSDWMLDSMLCRQCDVNESIGPVVKEGPYDAICAIEMIDHLENPRQFLRCLVENAKKGSWIIVSAPNPLDTFSCIAMFRRGTFAWASPEKYFGGGHISLLPHWLIEEHLKYLGVVEQEWHFLAPYRHPAASKKLFYQAIAKMRQLLARGPGQPFFEGQTALVIARIS